MLRIIHLIFSRFIGVVYWKLFQSQSIAVYYLEGVGPSNEKTKVYWTFNLGTTSMYPAWMFNERLDMTTERGWVHIPLEIQHPCLLPGSIKDQHCVAFHQTGPPEPILLAGIREGIFLTKAQLDKLQGKLKFKLPPRGKGHGKRGSIVKQDFAEALINHVFPDASDKEKGRMLAHIMGQGWKHLQPKSLQRHSDDILQAWNGLDTEDKPEFTGIAEVALDEVLLKERRAFAGRSTSDKPRVVEHATPRSIRDLVPPAQGCRITRHPALKRYQAFYTTESEEGLFHNLNFL